MNSGGVTVIEHCLTTVIGELMLGVRLDEQLENRLAMLAKKSKV